MTRLDPELLFGFNRKIAEKLVPCLGRTPLRPNHVTMLALALGLGAAAVMAGGSRAELLLGALLLHLSYLFDNCDGALARLKGLSSAFGMWFDYAADLVVDFALWWALAAATLAQGVHAPVHALAALACAGSAANFLRVVALRGRPAAERAPSGEAGAWKRAFTLLGDDGDPSVFVWILAALGYPGWFLFLGCFYVNFLWIHGTFAAGAAALRSS